MYRDALAAGAMQIGNQQFIFSSKQGAGKYALTAKGGRLGYYVDANSSEENAGYYDAEGRYVLDGTLVVSQRFVATQQKGPYDDDLREFIRFYFQDELNELGKMGKITWLMEAEIYETSRTWCNLSNGQWKRGHYRLESNSVYRCPYFVYNCGT